MRNRIASRVLLGGLLLSAPLAAQSTLTTTFRGTVSALAPAPTSGAFVDAQVGDPVTLVVIAELPRNSSSSTPTASYHDWAQPETRLEVGELSESLTYQNPYRFRITNGSSIDSIGVFQAVLSGGGLLRADALDTSGAAFESVDVNQERGTIPGSAFDLVAFGASVGGGFLEFSLDEVEIQPFGIGAVECEAEAAPNSTGAAARVNVLGSELVANDDVTLTASHLPPDVFGFFITSQDAAVTPNPGGSQGTLCLGGAIGRFNQASQILDSGPNGEFSLGVSLTSHPTPSGPVAVQPGETWRYQAWHRDTNPTPTSNFTDVIAVTYQ